MKEVLLRMFLEGEATAAELAADVIGTRAAGESYGVRSFAKHAVERMGRSFWVLPEHVTRLVDAVMANDLSRDDLGTVVFCMEAAPEPWRWDVDDPVGERV